MASRGPDPLPDSTSRQAHRFPAPRDPERRRLAEVARGRRAWYRWGPYLSDRQWGTVREDYSADGDAWRNFPYDEAAARAYRWGEDGLLGLSDDEGDLCFAPALWNGRDATIKRRLFGLSNPEGNHGEDVKELYYHLDGTPTSSYLKALYRYPQAAFPYDQLRQANAARSRQEPEFELLDTGVLDDGRFFDLTVEYAKAGPEDIVARFTVLNQGPEAALIHVLPTLWFRNTWSWGLDPRRPAISLDRGAGAVALQAQHHRLGRYWLVGPPADAVLMTHNESDTAALWGAGDRTARTRDRLDAAVLAGDPSLADPVEPGTMAALHYRWLLAPGEARAITLRLARGEVAPDLRAAAGTVARRAAEADRFYASVGSADTPAEARLVMRRAFAGLTWSRQVYHYGVARWLDGDPAGPPPPTERLQGRNHEWRHFESNEVLAMPDTWEYPWFASWDSAFHAVAWALIDPGFAKQQLLLLTREWYMHPNGQLPAYEWDLGAVDPPVLAWAALRVYQIERRTTGHADHLFLERIFHKLLLDFTWWVNRKDRDGRNVFSGGFLGLDNIGVFDRDAGLPDGSWLAQSDGTAWMGMFCLSMLAIACELAGRDQAYEDLATKFFEHFLYVGAALNDLGGQGVAMWDEDDEFFYDVLQMPDGSATPLKVRSLVGLIPLLAVGTLEAHQLDHLPDFRRRMRWFLRHRPDLAALVASWDEPGVGERRLLSLVHGHRMKRLLSRMLDPQEFLSDHGIRSLSRWHLDHPYRVTLGGRELEVHYEPAASQSDLFGGNSNWRGPVWFPLNYLLIEALQRLHHYYGEEFQVEFPTGSGEYRTLGDVADALSRRLIGLFLPGPGGGRPAHGGEERYTTDPAWRDLILFYEYFDGDTGAGLGASHQTGWTALVAKLIEQTGRRAAGAPRPAAGVIGSEPARPSRAGRRGGGV
ncbi:MAG TPA: hypothetical protein VID25_07820 [Candidatus Limnocylindrales bacterium]